jgi:hypothetical protein
MNETKTPLMVGMGGRTRKMATCEKERDAKEYLVSRIVNEAEQEGSPLTEVERKMLYFTETGWTLPDIMEVNAEFERDYDNDKYERRIAGLVRRIEEDNKSQGGEEQSAWLRAVEKRSEGDHYLLVLINPRLVNASETARPPGDFVKLVLAALALTAALLLFHWFRDH